MSLSITSPAGTRRSLTHWIALALVGAVLLVTLVLFGLVERFAHENAKRTAAAALDQIAWQMRDQLDRGMAYRFEEVHILAGLHELRPGTPPRVARTLLEQVRNSFPQYAWLGYADVDGTVLAANDGLLEGQNVGQRPWFKGALKGAFVGDVHKAVLLEKVLPRREERWRFVDVAVPIKDDEGNVQRVLGAHLSWEWAGELRRTLLAPAASSYGADIFVVDSTGGVILGPKGTEGKAIELPAFDALRKGKASQAIRTWGNGTPYVTAVSVTKGYGRYPGLGWVVVARQPEEVALAEYQKLRHQLLAGALLTSLLAALCAPLVARRLTGPLTALTRALARRSQGHDTDIPQVSGYQEAQQLSAALVAFTSREREHLDQLRAANESLEQRIEERTHEIRQREQELRTIIEQTDEAFIRIDQRGCVVEWNQHAEKTFGWRRQEALGARLSKLVIPPELHDAHHRGLQHYLTTGKAGIVDRRIEVPAVRKDGRRIEVEMVVSATRHNGLVTFNAFLHDIGDRKRMEADLRDSREQLRTIANNIPALVAHVDRDLRFRFANDTYQQWFGIDPQALMGQSMTDLYGAEAIASWQPHLDKVLAGERVEFERTRMVAGKLRHERATYLPQLEADGVVGGFYALVSDQTESKELALRLQNEAVHDALTGLPNRRHLMEHLPQALARAERLRQPLGLLFLDLNGFKAVNDTHGHEAGDELLQQVAFRLQGVLRKGDTVTRLAGDEFIILLEPLKRGLEDAQLVVAKIDDVLSHPFDLTQATVHVSTSTGISVYEPGMPRSADQLMAEADAAMYEAKKARRATVEAG